MAGHPGKLFAVGLLGVAVALAWMPRASPLQEGGETAIDSEEDDPTDENFVYRSRTLKSSTPTYILHDDPVKEAPVDNCLKRCSDNILSNCPKFFAGDSWPPSSYGDSSASRACRICQRQEDSDKVFFATLYNPYFRIPEYTATAITRNRKAKSTKRNDSLWKRVQLGLCSNDYLNGFSKSTKKWGVRKIETRDKTKLEEECGDCQALCEDLGACGLHIGHINPRHINDNEQDAVDATFSMINMAPQAPYFNGVGWAGIERQIANKAEEIFEKAKANKILYVITGTKTDNTLLVNVFDYLNVDNYIPGFQADNWVKGRVLFPKYFWVAVCYTGDTGAGLEAFGYGYYGLNRDVEGEKSKIEKLSLPEFDRWLYGTLWGYVKHIFQGSLDCTSKNLRMRDEL
ncbi:uncharacterized protein LOC144918422 [Branchiostoma floridae x Branchiostoma belcheri]